MKSKEAKTICGADCTLCELYKKKCEGCNETNACPFGKKCWIAKYIESGGEENFNIFKKQLIDEINALQIDGMPKIDDLIPLTGSYINMEYVLPNHDKVKLLSDEESYLGNQVECIFNDEETIKLFGIACNMDFILISEYDNSGSNPEIILYKKR